MVATVISVIVGAIISYLIAKWQMKKNKIVHFTMNSYDIGKGLSDEFPDFKLHFADETLADNVMVLKGGFMNTGRNDIDGLKGENDIRMILPEECKIKAITVSPSTENLIVDVKKDNAKENILLFGISELFKTDEYFKYTAIVEMSKVINELHSKLKFQHRISNTEKIRNTYIGSQRSLARNRYYKMIISFLSVLLVLLLIVGFSYQKIKYKIYKNNNQEVEIYIDPYSNLYVNEGIPVPFISGTKISSNELEKEYRIVPITEYNWRSFDSVMLIIASIMSFITILLSYYLAFEKNGHIINVLGEYEKNKET